MARVWAQMACRDNSQSGKHYPWKPIDLEGLPPTDGLLAGIVCLSPTLAGSLKDAVVAHVVENMEDEGLNIQRDWILYSISLPRATIFWLSFQKIVEAALWAQRGSGKEHETGAKGAGHIFERMT